LRPQPVFAPGTVWLAGAGPGDPELLTRLAARAIAEADVILHDALVGDGLLAEARADALVEYAGKRAGGRSCHQQDICARMVAHARAGNRVLRLKGGDPFVFGRGGEEAEALAAAGVPFRIVPGVTAGIGGLAYAGIPVTHRACGSAVAFVTGHGSNGTLPDNLDWDALARGVPSIVFYMGLRTLGAIAARLMAAGRAPETPVAVVSNASLPEQTVIVSTLADCAEEAKRLDAKAPAVIAVGEVVRLRDALADWQEIGTTAGSPAKIDASLPQPALGLA
jgi:uroporphyrin-III C-methyltransferase